MKSFDGYLKLKLGNDYVLLAGGGSTIDRGFHSRGNIILDTSGGGASPYLGFKRGIWENLDYWDWKTYNVSGDLMFDIFDSTNSWVNIFKITNTAAYIKGNIIYHSGNLPTYPTLSSLGIKSRYVTLNGEAFTYYSPYAESLYTGAAFYAPTTAGTQHYVLESNGSGAPTWTNSPIFSGRVMILTASWGNQLILDRISSDGSWGPSILFNYDGVNKGSISMDGFDLYIGNNGSYRYKVLNESNYTTWINTTNFPGLFSVNTDSKVEQHNVSGEGYTNIRPLLFSDTSHASAPSSFTSVTARTYFTPNIYGIPENGDLFLKGKLTAGSGDFTGNVILGTSGSGATPYLGFKRGTFEDASYNDWKIYCTSGDLYFDVYSSSPSAGWHTILRLCDDYNAYVNGYKVYHTGNLTYGTLGLNLRTVSLNGLGYTYISPYKDATDGYPAWYAPTSAGTSDYILKSNGSGAPSWTNAPTLTGNLTLYSASGNTPLLRFLRGVWENNSLYDWRVYNSGGELYFDVYDVNGWSNSFRMGISDTSYATYIHGNLVYHSGNLPDVNNVSITVADSSYTSYRPMLTDASTYSGIDASFSGGNHKLLSSNKIYFAPGTGNMATLGDIKLYTPGTDATPAIIFLRRNDSDTTYNDWKIYGSSGYFYIDLNYNGSWRNAMWIHENGSIYASNYYTTSDARKKQNIHKISDNIKQFEWKETGETSYGFVAQDLEVKHPELVNDDGNMKTVNYNAALSLVVAKLENRVKELEAKLGLETPPLYLTKVVKLPSFRIEESSFYGVERRAA